MYFKSGVAIWGIKGQEGEESINVVNRISAGVKKQGAGGEKEKKSATQKKRKNSAKNHP